MYMIKRMVMYFFLLIEMMWKRWLGDLHPMKNKWPARNGEQKILDMMWLRLKIELNLHGLIQFASRLSMNVSQDLQSHTMDGDIGLNTLEI